MPLVLFKLKAWFDIKNFFCSWWMLLFLHHPNMNEYLMIPRVSIQKTQGSKLVMESISLWILSNEKLFLEHALLMSMKSIYIHHFSLAFLTITIFVSHSRYITLQMNPTSNNLYISSKITFNLSPLKFVYVFDTLRRRKKDTYLNGDKPPLGWCQTYKMSWKQSYIFFNI